MRPHDDDDVGPLVTLAKRAWTEVEAAIDAVLGSPLDRLATPSWDAHHEAVVRTACGSPRTSVIVAEDGDGHIVGFVAYTLHGQSEGMSAYGEVVVIGVDPRARSRGLGSALLDRAVTDLRDAGAPVIMVETGGDDGHGPARALYESAGFTRLPIAQYWLPGAVPAGRRDTSSA
jgi:ribosomal protein S18 acetylase RimI-like enzyme